MNNKPKIVVLCGSSRFIEIMAVTAWLIEKEENAITLGLHLIPSWYSEKPIPDHLAEYEGVSKAMDELHLKKIDLADEIFVINYEDYIGQSTSNEIIYARSLGKKIRWFTHDSIGEKVKQIMEKALQRMKNAIYSQEMTIHEWFELSYAQYLTIPRSVLQSMPYDWQYKFTALLNELDEAIDWRPKEGRYWVKLKDAKGKYIHGPLMDYNRGRRQIPFKPGYKPGGKDETY